MENKIYIFHRENMFYPLELKDDNDAVENAEYNDGTLRVEDLEGNVIWENKNLLEQLGFKL